MIGFNVFLFMQILSFCYLYRKLLQLYKFKDLSV
uniref:Uncharacterized protein n=1 Tax=Rhizophora mucronata TaxID=61149 RepID=A0A2P2P174_RHIMU